MYQTAPLPMRTDSLMEQYGRRVPEWIRRPASDGRLERATLRLTPAQYRAFSKAAADAGLPLTTWLRTLGIQENRKLEKAAKE